MSRAELCNLSGFEIVSYDDVEDVLYVLFPDDDRPTQIQREWFVKMAKAFPWEKDFLSAWEKENYPSEDPQEAT